eukprot:11067545-Alexandrium_andersonii.AAC.1
MPSPARPKRSLPRVCATVAEEAIGTGVQSSSCLGAGPVSLVQGSGIGNRAPCSSEAFKWVE